MGLTYSFNSAKITKAVSMTRFFYFRGYAYTNGYIPFPFSDQDYTIFVNPFDIAIYQYCDNCIIIEFSIGRFLGDLGTFAVFGRFIENPKLYSKDHKYILDTSLDRIETPFCVIDNFPITYFFDKIDFGDTVYNNWSYSKGETCRYIDDIIGYDFTDLLAKFEGLPDEYDAIASVIKTANKLVLTRAGLYTDEFLLETCMHENDFETNYHCNSIMFKYCSSGNLTNSRCVAWMDGITKQHNSIGLELYLPYCKKNLNRTECSYFSQASLGYDYRYRDEAIKAYCSSNPNSLNCKCTNTDVAANNLITSYLGPKACWLSSCTLKSLDNKYLLTEDINTRNKCKINSCSINIGSIELTSDSSTVIDLMNQCMSQTNQQQIIGRNQNSRYKYSQTFFNTFLIYIIPFLLFLVIVIFIEYFIKKRMFNKISKSGGSSKFHI